MIVSKTNIAPTIEGIILIDCWESEEFKFFVDVFYINLINYLKKLQIKCIINSANNLILDSNDRSISNTFGQYGHINATDSDSSVIINMIGNGVHTHETSHLIKKYLLNTNTSICITERSSFLHHCNTKFKRSPIKNWLVAGQSWQLCTHDHGLGLIALSKISASTGMNFYATNLSFCKIDGKTARYNDFNNDTLQWEYITDFGYRLLPA